MELQLNGSPVDLGNFCLCPDCGRVNGPGPFCPTVHGVSWVPSGYCDTDEHAYWPTNVGEFVGSGLVAVHKKKPKRRKVRLKRYEVFAMRNGRAEIIWTFEAATDAEAAKIFSDVVPGSVKATFREVRKP